MNKQKKIFHCALLKKKIYLPKRSFMIAQTISLDILYSLQDCNVSCIAAAPLLRYPEMSAIDLKKFQKTDDASLPCITAFRDKLVLMKMGKEILGYQWSLKDNRPVLTYFLNQDALQGLIITLAERSFLPIDMTGAMPRLFWGITGNLKSKDTSRTAKILITFLFNLIITGQTKSCTFTPFIVI